MGSRSGQDDDVDDATRTSEPSQLPASDVRVAVPTRTYDHMAKVARDARDLLGALSGNVEWLRSAFGEEAPSDALLRGLSDIETCCERLNNMLEDALVGARREGLSIQRSPLSLASVLAVAAKQVAKNAEAKRVSFSVSSDVDIVARLDRALFTRALVNLMTRIIADSPIGAEVRVSFAMERGDIGVTFSKGANSVRESQENVRLAGSPANDAAETDLDFCYLVAQAHGGSLALGTGDALYRLALPWVGAVGPAGSAGP